MATTQNAYTGDNSTVLYSFTFPYLDRSHVKITLDEVATTAFTFANATQIQFNTAPGTGVRIRIFRETDVDVAEATYFAGSSVRHNALNDNQLQALYSAQEIENNKWGKNTETIDSTETWSSSDTKIATTAAIQTQTATQIATALTGDVVAGNAITVTDNSPSTGKITVAVTNNAIDTAELVDNSVTTPKIADDAVTVDKIANNTIVDANISASAAIDGSKLNVELNDLSNVNVPTPSTNEVLKWSGSEWVSGVVSGSAAAAVEFIETPQTITTNKVIAANINAGMMGPTVAINSGISITVGANSLLTVLK